MTIVMMAGYEDLASSSSWMFLLIGTVVMAVGLAWWIMTKRDGATESSSSTSSSLSKNDNGNTAPVDRIGASKTTLSDNASVINDTTGSSIDDENNNNNAPAADDVWEERRRRGIAPASLHHKRGVETPQKPFGSSYYYAHNNPHPTGGYKDGLRMEDYAMNGPRLLRKGGKPVGNTPNATPNTTTSASSIPSTTAEDATATTTDTAQNIQQQRRRRRIPITQYLWDDDGGKTGTILIDKLPGALSTDSPIPWSQVMKSKQQQQQNSHENVASSSQENDKVPGPVVNFLSKTALKSATSWVKKESEKNPTPKRLAFLGEVSPAKQ